MIRIIAKIARRCGINLKYIFDPRTAYSRREPLRLPRKGNMTRRAILAALPATGAAMALPHAAQAKEADTPILRLFRQHRTIIGAASEHVCAATGKGEDAELERLFYRRADQIEAEMMALPCTCAADFAAKVIVDTCQGALFSDWETGAIWQEARALTARNH